MVLKRGASTAASGSGGGGAVFAIGTMVEVCSNDVGFKGSWYEATITRAHPRRRAYDVEYLSLVDDADPSQPLRETARSSLIRPRAPRLTAGARYIVDELVDAYHDDGWWPGIVSAAHGGDPPDGYTICFPGSREVLEFAASEIRPHLDWRYGQWFPPQNQSGAAFGEGAHVELSGDKDNYGAVWLLATVIKVLTKNIYLVEYKKHKRDGSDELLREFVDAQYVRPVPRSTPEGIMRFALHELVEAWHCGGWVLGVVSKIVDISKYIVKLMYEGEEEIELSHSEMRRHYDWINGQWVHGPKTLVKKDPTRRQVLHVKGCLAGSKAENLLEQGDMILAINNEPITCFRDIENICQELDKCEETDGRLNMTIFRQGQEIELLVGTDVRDGNGTTCMLSWCGCLIQDPHPSVRALGFLPEEGHGVYIARLLDVSMEELQNNFDAEASDSNYARNFLEYCCFRALALCTQVTGHLGDPKFRRLTFDMMLS